MSKEFAGTLRERVIIERPLAMRSPTGLREEGWEQLCRIRAAIEPDGAGPEAEAMSLSAMPRFRVTIRTRDDIAIDQRVRWGPRVLMVRQIAIDPRTRDRMTMRCEEVRA